MLYVVRHGQTDWNNKKITMGRKNIPLNDEGIRQAENIKEIIKNYNIDIIICSPLERAKLTADIINKNKMTKIICDDRIMERSLGELEGKSYPSDNDELWDINLNTNKYEIEPMKDFKEIVYNFVDEIVAQYPNKNILVVTHGGVTALINCYFNNKEKEGNISNKFLKNCSIASYDTKK